MQLATTAGAGTEQTEAGDGAGKDVDTSTGGQPSDAAGEEEAAPGCHCWVSEAVAPATVLSVEEVPP